MTERGSFPNDDASVELLRAMLDGSTDLAGDAAAFEALAQVVSSLRAPASPGEVRGEAAAVAAFAHATSSGRARASSWRSRIGVPATLFAGKFALGAGVALAATSVAAVTAAYTGSLPAPLQRFAHTVIRAPQPHHVSPGSTPGSSTPAKSRPAVGATGAATPSAIPAQASNLCQAYRATANTPDQSAVASRLRLLLGGGADLSAYCAQLPGGAGTSHSAQSMPSERPNPTAAPHGRQGTAGGGAHTPASTHQPSHGNPHSGNSSGQPPYRNTTRPGAGAPGGAGSAAPASPAPGRPSTPSNSSGHSTGRP